MNSVKPIVIGLISGAVAVLASSLSRVMRPPPDRILPEVIRLDSLDAYASASSTEPAGLLRRAVLDRTVESFVVKDQSLAHAITLLAELANVNIVVDWSEFNYWQPPLSPSQPVTLSLRGKTVDRILHAIFDPIRKKYDDYEYKPLFWFVLDGIIYITDEDDFSSSSHVLRVYDVRDLMLEGARFSRGFVPTTRPAEFDHEVVMQASEQDVADRLLWAVTREGDRYPDEIGRGYYFAGRIIFSATPAGHLEIERRLEMIRKTP